MQRSLKHQPASNTDIQAQLLQVFDATPVPMILSRPDGSFEYANPAVLKLFGYSADEIYHPDIIISHPDEAAVNRQLREQLINDPFTPVKLTKRYLHKSGRIINGLLTIVAEPDEQGRIKRFISQIYDQTQELAQAEQRKLSSLVYQNSNEAMLVTDADNIILDVNPAFTTITGYSLDEVIGRTPKLLSSGRHEPDFYSAMWQELEQNGCWNGEIWNKRKNGEAFAEWLSINSILNEDGSIYRRVALFTDISRKKAAEALILQQANYDSLTNLPNRRLFLESLKQELRKTRGNGISGAVLYVDLDRFKEVNDALGHGYGDKLLQEVARRLTRTVRASDLVAHLSGDEFAVILGSIGTPQQAEQVAGNILASLAESIQLKDEQIYISASIGITLFPDDAVKADQLLRNADQAMYAAKLSGRNCYHYFTQTMQSEAQVRLNMTRDLRFAVERQEFELFYQPIVDFATGQIVKAEALIRWHHPQQGLITPDSFIPLAEETGMITRIGEWVFHTAARQLKQWHLAGHTNLRISINLSPVQLRHDGVTPDDWLQYLTNQGLDESAITVEITENQLMANTHSGLPKLAQLQKSGLQIAIDDFGTGYSSLSYLKDLNADFLKIDQSFVRNLTDDNSDAALCEAIIVMAHKLGIQVIAEGVETEHQRQLLQQAGCDYGQGWVFAKAIPAAEFATLLQTELAPVI